MSSSDVKFSHSKRLQKDENAIKKQVKIAKEHHLTEPGKFLEEAHRYHKKHAMNCGNPGCSMCGNPRKIFGKLTPQEKRLFQDLDAQTDKKSNGVKPPDDTESD